VGGIISIITTVESLYLELVAVVLVALNAKEARGEVQVVSVQHAQ
jgi:hypothetical protein